MVQVERIVRNIIYSLLSFNVLLLVRGTREVMLRRYVFTVYSDLIVT